ncbi:MAG TPA: HepT-like ribonuclease domain-containing protein [Pyrinomonadaceae bacterium]|nr:HepT-like ribonuclease domain-containing protein [Pyrinomonadaceae bacterium]
MSKPDRDAAALRHMLDHAREATSFARGKTRADLDTDRLLNLALTRLLEITGEAASRVAENVRARHPEIPWPQIVGLRNRLIHGYDSVDLDILWQIVTGDLPPLIASLESIINEKP